MFLYKVFCKITVISCFKQKFYCNDLSANLDSQNHTCYSQISVAITQLAFVLTKLGIET